MPEKVNPISFESFSSSWGEINTDVGIKFLIGEKTNLLGISHFLYQNPIDKNKDGFTVEVQAGAGVVADSIPSNEYQETLNKAKGMFTALACLDPQDL